MPELHVPSGRGVEWRREDGGERHCFKCRQRRPHVAVLLGPEFSPYYKPFRWELRCESCGEDHTEFPARW